MCIVYGASAQTSVSVFVNRRNLIQVKCVQCVVSQCSVLHSQTSCCAQEHSVVKENVIELILMFINLKHFGFKIINICKHHLDV